MTNEVANTIAQQLGFALRMIGAKNLLAHQDGLSFRIGRNSSGINHIKITLDPSDTYSMTFTKVPSTRQLCAGKEPKTVASVSGVYVDAMKRVIESNTGLYTSL